MNNGKKYKILTKIEGQILSERIDEIYRLRDIISNIEELDKLDVELERIQSVFKQSIQARKERAQLRVV